MELSTQNAFQVIFPKYVELLSESTLPTDQSLQGFIREQLPQKVQLVRSIEATFLAFQTQFTNLILKRPKQQNLFQSLTIKASQKIQHFFTTLQSTVTKHSTLPQFSSLNLQQLRPYFRQKLKDMQQLINQKYFDNINLQRSVQEQITKRLYNLNQLYFFLKSDFTSLAAKFKVKQHEVLTEINRSGKERSGKSVSELIYLEDKLMDSIGEVVEKRYRPFVGKKDFFYSKLKQIQAQTQSKVPMNVTVLVQSILSKQKYRLNKQISASLSKQLKLIDPSLQQQTQQQCKQIINQVDCLKRQFNQLKNNVFYLDIIRGTFSQRYKMQLNKLQNIYYLSNIEKYLQDVQTFTEKLIRVEERIIENRKGFMKKLGKQIEEKVIGLVGEYEMNGVGGDLRDVIDRQFDMFKDALYGIIAEGKDDNRTQHKYSNAEEARRRRLQQAQDRRRELQYEKEEKQRQRRKQLQERAQKQRQKRQEDKWKLQEKRKAEDQRMQRMRQEREEKQRLRKIQQQEKERARKIQMQQKMREKRNREKEDMQRMREDSKRKEEQMKRKQEQRKIRETEDVQKRERLRKEKEEQQQRKRQQLQNKRSRQQKEKRQRQQRDRRQRQQRQKRQREQKERMLQKKRQQQQRQRQEKLQRQKQERQRKQRQLKLQKQRQQEKFNRQRQEEERRRQEQERQRRERDEKQKKQRQQREKDERERKQKQRQKQLQKQRKQADEKQRQKLQQAQRDRRDKEERERRQKEQKKQREQRQRKQRQDRERKQREDRQRREKQAREKREKQERQQNQRRERQQKQRKQREEKLKRERQEKQRKEKQQREKREREQQQRQRKQQEQRQLKLKQKKQQEQRERRQREQKQRKQLQMLMQQQENSKKNKSKVSNDRSKKNGSGINYNDFDDILDDDLQQIQRKQQQQNKNQSQVSKSKVAGQQQQQQYGDDYQDDFQSPQKQQQGIQPKQLIQNQNIKCLNDYMKGTSYARKNKPNLQPFNNKEYYTYLFEELIENKKVFIFDSAVAKAIIDFGRELMDEDAMQDDLKMSIQTIKQEMFNDYASKLQQDTIDPRTILILPFSFENQFGIRLIEFLPEVAWFRTVLSKEIEDEETQAKFNSVLEGLMHIFQIEAEPQLQPLIIPPQSQLVLQTFDKQLPCLLTLFAMHYEQQLKQQMEITQYTVERFFYTAHVLKPFYQAIQGSEEELTNFYHQAAEKFAANDTIQILPLEVNGADPNYEAVLQQNALQAKNMFLTNKKLTTLLVMFQVLIFSGPQQGQQGEQSQGGFQKIVIYCSMEKTQPKPTITYYIVTKDDLDKQNASTLFDIASEGDDPFEVQVFMDFTRHNGLTQYSDWTLPVWARSVQKRKLSAVNAFRAMTFALSPYYIAYKQQD